MRHFLVFLSLMRYSALATCHNGRTLIQQKYPLAAYSHCCSHVLNLAVVRAQLDFGTFSTISKVFTEFL